MKKMLGLILAAVMTLPGCAVKQQVQPVEQPFF